MVELTRDSEMLDQHFAEDTDEAQVHDSPKLQSATQALTMQETDDSEDEGSVPDESGDVPEESERQLVPISTRKCQTNTSGGAREPLYSVSENAQEVCLKLEAAVDHYLPPVKALPSIRATEQHVSRSSFADDLAILSARSLSSDEVSDVVRAQVPSSSPKSKTFVSASSTRATDRRLSPSPFKEYFEDDGTGTLLLSALDEAVQEHLEVEGEYDKMEGEDISSQAWLRVLKSDAEEYRGAFECESEVPAAALQSAPEGSYFYVQEIEVHEPPEQDGSLGLLLSGNVVVAFSCPEAEASGWHIGDQIVKVNGRSCENFSQFVKNLAGARDVGFPIGFSVLRCECGTECNLDDTPNLANLVEHAESLQLTPRFLKGALVDGQKTVLKPSDWRLQGSSEGRESVFENPYIDALRRRRDNLYGHAEGWNISGHVSAEDNSLASRLATQREGIASLTREEVPEQRKKIRGRCWALDPCAIQDDPYGEYVVTQFTSEHEVTALRREESECGFLSIFEEETEIPKASAGQVLQELPSLHVAEARGMQVCCRPEPTSPAGHGRGVSTLRPPCARTKPCCSPRSPRPAEVLSEPSAEPGCIASVLEVCRNQEVSETSDLSDPGLLAEVSGVLPAGASSVVSVPGDAQITAVLSVADPSGDGHATAAALSSDEEPEVFVDLEKFIDVAPKLLGKGQKKIKIARKPRLETVEEHPFGNDNEDDDEEDELDLDVMRKALARSSSPGLLESSAQDDETRNFAMQFVQKWGPAG